MRLQTSSVRPFRRAIDALKLVRSPAGMPTSTTRPPGRVETIASSIAASSPATSKATSTPAANRAGRAPRPRPRLRARRFRARRRTRPRVSTRWGSRSVASTTEAPAAERACTSSSPSGPQPNTPTVIPGATRPRSSACRATPSGSSSVPSASRTVSGIACRSESGQAIQVRSAPSVVPCPAKRRTRQR